MINRYTLFGNPVEHSLSPQIHKLFASQAERRVEYSATLSTGDSFEADVKSFRDAGNQGCNVTLPFKEKAFQMCNTLSESARVAGACNTINFLADGQLAGFNTDGSGLLVDLKSNIGFAPANSKILIIGAGGATRGVLQPLLAEQPECLLIANRTVEKAEQLATSFTGYGNIEAISLDELAAHKNAFDLVINATSAGLQGETLPIPASVFSASTYAYDFSYSRDPENRSTAFIELAKSQGCCSANDGLGMLLEQAADAFFIWEDVRPKTRMIGPQLIQLQR